MRTETALRKPPAPSLSLQPPSPPLSTHVNLMLGKAHRWMSIGDIAREYGMTLRALRFYESKGLIAPLRQGSQRLYSARDRARIQIILTAKELGFTLAEIAGLLDDSGEGGELQLDRDTTLRQIEHLERQHKAIDQALASLRQRYYMMVEVAMEPDPAA
jgi:DNA-binding transcriptional MerR regulator